MSTIRASPKASFKRPQACTRSFTDTCEYPPRIPDRLSLYDKCDMHGFIPLPFPRLPNHSHAESSLILECALVSRIPTMPTIGSSCRQSSRASYDAWTKPRPACGYAASSFCNKWFSCRHQALWILGYVQWPTTYSQRAYSSQRPDGGDISLALVPRDHPVIPYASLEAEGHGLLDRLLDIIHGDHRLDKL
jgi:hypothetical protein